jgi:hypothetical protein
MTNTNFRQSREARGLPADVCQNRDSELERAMGIEPKRTALKSLQNTAFRDSEKPACDWRANFRVMRDNVGLPETTPPFAIEFPLSTLCGRSRAAASVHMRPQICSRRVALGVQNPVACELTFRIHV